MTDYEDRLWWIALGAMMVGSPTSKTLKDKLKDIRPRDGKAAVVFEALLKDSKADACKWLEIPENGTVLDSVADTLREKWYRRRTQQLLTEIEYSKTLLKPDELAKWLRDKADALERAITT